jgi:hypothetical protein
MSSIITIAQQIEQKASLGEIDRQNMNVGHMASPLIAPDWRSLASYDAGRRGHPPHQFSNHGGLTLERGQGTGYQSIVKQTGDDIIHGSRSPGETPRIRLHQARRRPAP